MGEQIISNQCSFIAAHLFGHLVFIEAAEIGLRSADVRISVDVGEQRIGKVSLGPFLKACVCLVFHAALCTCQPKTSSQLKILTDFKR